MSIESRIKRIEKIAKTLDKKEKQIDMVTLYAALTYEADSEGKLNAKLDSIIDTYDRIKSIEKNTGLPFAEKSLEFAYGKEFATKLIKVLKEKNG
jgi:uncharacterized protein YihD (DUF1040 family)